MITALSIFLALQLIISFAASQFIRGETGYLAAGRNLGVLPVAISLFATWFGAETIMGSSAAVAREGLAGSRADPFGYAISLLLLALVIAFRFRAKGYITLGDFFRERYGQNTERLAVLIYIPTSIVWAAAQLLAFGLVIASSTGVSLDVAMIFTAVYVIFYTTLGGLLGDVISDVVQAIILVIGLSILLFVIIGDAGGVGRSISLIEPSQLNFVPSGESLLARVDTWMIPILGSLITQEAISRTLAAKNAHKARNGALLGSLIYLTAGSIPILATLIGVHLKPELRGEENFLPMLAQAYLSPAMYVIFAGALISAILSTVNSTLLAVGGLFAHNFAETIFKVSQARRLKFVKLCVAVSGFIAYLIAISGDTIYDLLETASSFGSAGILVITVIGMWSGFGNHVAAISALIVGVVFSALGSYGLTNDAPFLTSIAASFFTFVFVSFIYNKPPVEQPIHKSSIF